MDGTSGGSFVKCWSDFARGGDQVDNNNKPDFTTAAILFPPRPWAALVPPRAPLPFSKLDGNKLPTGCVVKVFRFSPQCVLTLQANARSSDRLLKPTRLEAVFGFIWKHAMVAAAKSKNAPSIGQDEDNEAKISSVPELSDLISEISRALASAKDVEFLNKLKGEKGSEKIRENKQKLADYSKDDANINVYRCTSWSKVGLDYPDFGFLGKSVWSGHSGVLKNQILFIMNSNQGIEVSLTLDEKEMECLQSNSEFLQFACPT
uniref:Uncharacterized protein n=1 Tax=Chenopodium quinoa TaxID=63459 RepID=A0A803LGK7_CHEQI